MGSVSLAHLDTAALAAQAADTVAKGAAATEAATVMVEAGATATGEVAVRFAKMDGKRKTV